jgi:hypothetical protein
VADVDTAALAIQHHIDFTFYWPGGGRWEGVDFHVQVLTPAP